MKKQTIAVAILCVLCAVPALAIGYMNRPMTVELLSKPFVKPSAPKESQTLRDSGVAYTERSVKVPPLVVNGLAKNPNRAAPPRKTDKKDLAPTTVIETPEVNVIGTNVNEEEVSTMDPDDVVVWNPTVVGIPGGAAWMQDSLVGGTVRITGFQPGE